MTRIVYAFRNHTWPRPMEGLDLFTPSVQDHSVSSDSGSDFESGDDDEYQVGSDFIAKRVGLRDPGGVGGEMERTRDFEIEKVSLLVQINYP